MIDISPSLIRVLDKFKSAFNVSDILPGSKLYSLAESIAQESATIEDDLSTYASKNSIISAKGADLTALAEYPFGISRIKPTQSKVTSSMKAIKFYTNNKVPFGELNRNANGTMADIIIPEGIIISGNANDNRYSFRVTQQATLRTTDTEAYINAEIINGDFKIIPSNTLRSHNFVGYTQSSSNTLLVTNPIAIGTASEEESDDNLRYRLITALQSKVDSSYYGIRNALLTLPGISNVNIFPGSSGGGSFTVIVQGTTPITSDDIIEKSKQYLSQIVPDWITYNVIKPNYLGITSTIEVNAGTTVLDQSTLGQISESIKSYINNFIGQIFKPLYLQNIAMSVSSQIYSATVTNFRLYSGIGDYRMYENVSLNGTDPSIYVSLFDKVIVESDIDTPITVVQVQ